MSKTGQNQNPDTLETQWGSARGRFYTKDNFCALRLMGIVTRRELLHQNTLISPNHCADMIYPGKSEIGELPPNETEEPTGVFIPLETTITEAEETVTLRLPGYTLDTILFDTLQETLPWQ